MKKLAFVFVTFLALFANAQKSTDAELNQRLQDYLAWNKQLNFEKVMDYMHPKLFSIAPREMIVQSMEQAFNSDGMSFRFDSMKVISVSPSYKFSGASYKKVSYFMSMTVLLLKDSTDLANKELASIMKQSFQAGFPGKKISLDIAKNTVNVAGSEIMFAVKDESVTEWMFLGYDQSNDELISRLYPKQVRQYFKLL